MSEVLAKVGGIEITDADVDAFIESLPQEQKHYASNPHFRNRCKEQLIDNLLTMKDFLTSSYAQAGMDVTDITKETVTFLGQTHHVLKLSCSIQGMPCYMIQYYDYWAGEYGAVITFSSYLEDKTADLLELFYAVE